SKRADASVQDKTKDEVREQLREVCADFERAKREGNSVDMGWLEKEKATLLMEMCSSRTQLIPSQENNARNAVCKAIRKAIDSILAKNRDMHRHLDESIHLGFALWYAPQGSIKWTLQ